MRDEGGLFVVFVVSLIIIVGGACLIIQPNVCYARWEGTKEARWSIFGGCQVKVEGVFVPEDRVWFERNQ